MPLSISLATSLHSCVQYFQEMSSAKTAADTFKSQLRDVCSQLVALPPDVENVDYNDLVLRAQDEVATLMKQVIYFYVM